jgi:hypothetical protein
VVVETIYRSQACLPYSLAWPQSRSAAAAPTATGCYTEATARSTPPTPHRNHPTGPAQARPTAAEPPSRRWTDEVMWVLKRGIARAVDQWL